MNFFNLVQLTQGLLVYSNAQENDEPSNPINIDDILKNTGFRDTVDNHLPALFSFHGLDVVAVIDGLKSTDERNIEDAEKELVKAVLYKAIEKIGTRTYPVFTMDKFNEFNNIINRIIKSVNSVGNKTSEEINTEIANIKQGVRELKAFFKTPYILSYQDKATAEANYGTKGQPSVKILTKDFASFRDGINRTIQRILISKIKAAGPSIPEKSILKTDPTYITRILSNWGHTKTDAGLVSSKLLKSLIGLKNITQDESLLKIVATDFINVTKQAQTSIQVTTGTLTKGSREVLQVVVESLLFQSVLFQDKVYNQETLGRAEQKWNFIEFLKSNRKQAKLFRKKLGVNASNPVASFISKFLVTRQSPSLLEKIELKLVGALTGKSVNITKSSKKTPSVTSNVKTKIRKVKLQSKDKNLGKISKSTGGPRVSQSITQATNLVTLQRLLDAHLHEKIRRNMGTGNRKDVLNYRTGRFAESVKVERLSESRQGMITAFYSYMKNPYATFSTGGRQELPRTRDPKTLIARSIREVAQTLVTNRLRAVNV